jgi:hypothetical protein
MGKSLDDCTGEEWNAASKAVGWGTAKALVIPEPAPVQNTLPGVWGLVQQDMAARDQFGVDKYGLRLQPHNGRDALKDAYQEALDLAVYLRTVIYERDGK